MIQMKIGIVDVLCVALKKRLNFILRLGSGERFSAPYWDFILLLIFCDSHSCAQALCVLGGKLSSLICILEIILLVFFF